MYIIFFLRSYENMIKSLQEKDKFSKLFLSLIGRYALAKVKYTSEYLNEEEVYYLQSIGFIVEKDDVQPSKIGNIYYKVSWE